MSQAERETNVVNPHFDEDRVVWSDDYSGVYEPPTGEYGDQFDFKWQLVLEDRDGAQGYNQGLGSRTDDEAIDALVYEWTGRYAGEGEPPKRSALDTFVDPALIEGRSCIDVGCGSGRWTRVMQALGAKDVLSVDISPHALESVTRFNSNTLVADVSRLTEVHPELVGRYEFANLWGVAHHTHDPRLAFMNAAATVAEGGAMYLMVYSTDGLHNTDVVKHYRRQFRTMHTTKQRLAYVEAISQRKWHWKIPLETNLRNIARNLLGRPRPFRIGVLDMLMPFYNWVIPLDVAVGWMEAAGFRRVTELNAKQVGRAAHHLLGEDRSAA